MKSFRAFRTIDYASAVEIDIQADDIRFKHGVVDIGEKGTGFHGAPNGSPGHFFDGYCPIKENLDVGITNEKDDAKKKRCANEAWSPTKPIPNLQRSFRFYGFFIYNVV